MLQLINLLKNAPAGLLNGENGLFSVIKENNGKLSSRRIFKLAGGGSLITLGLSLIESGFEAVDPNVMKYKVFVGLVLTGLGSGVGVFMAKDNNKAAAIVEKQ